MMKMKKTFKRFMTGFLSICMVITMAPGLSAEASGLGYAAEDDINELVCSYMDSREIAIMTGNTESMERVAVSGIVNDENAHRAVLSESLVCVTDMSY